MQKVSISLQGHSTSFSLEPEFLALLRALAKDRNLSLAALVSQVDERRASNLSSSLRLEILMQVARGAGPALQIAFDRLSHQQDKAL